MLFSALKPSALFNIDLILTIVYKIYGPVLPSNEANLSISNT